MSPALDEILSRGVDANVVIDKLVGQLGEAHKQLAVKDATIDVLVGEIARLKENEGK